MFKLRCFECHPMFVSSELLSLKTGSHGKWACTAQWSCVVRSYRQTWNFKSRRIGQCSIYPIIFFGIQHFIENICKSLFVKTQIKSPPRDTRRKTELKFGFSVINLLKVHFFAQFVRKLPTYMIDIAKYVFLISFGIKIRFFSENLSNRRRELRCCF